MDGPVSSPPEPRPDEPLGPPPAPSADEAPAPSPAPVATPPAAATDVDQRVAALEAGMADLGRRMERVGETVEESVRAAISGELRAVTADLRHTVSELGRLLVRDLGRLAHLLAEHRDSIVAELRPPGARPATGAAPDDEAGGAGASPGESRAAPDRDVLAGDDPDHDLGGGQGGDRGRRGRLRRRSS